MCVAGDTPAKGRKEGEGLEREVEEGEENAALALSPDLDEDTATAPIADADEAEPTRMGTEDEVHVGYLQISDEPSGQSEMEEENDVEEVGNSDPPLVNGGLSSGQSNGNEGSLQSGYVVSNGRNAGEKIVTVNGMQFHVYGNMSGLEFLGASSSAVAGDLNLADSDDEEEEERRRIEGERAIAEANEADAARRTAPISPEHRVRIVNAMKGINLGGYRPAWADAVPEDQWIGKIKESANTVAK